MRTKNKPKATKHLPWFVFRIDNSCFTVFLSGQVIPKIEMEHSLRHGRLGLGPDGMPLAPWPPLAASGRQALILQRCRPSHPMISWMSKVKPTPLPSNSDTDEFKRQVPLRKKCHPMATFSLCQAKLGMLHLKSPTKACYDVNTCEIHCETHHRNLW